MSEELFSTTPDKEICENKLLVGNDVDKDVRMVENSSENSGFLLR